MVGRDVGPGLAQQRRLGWLVQQRDQPPLDQAAGVGFVGVTRGALEQLGEGLTQGAEAVEQRADEGRVADRVLVIVGRLELGVDRQPQIGNVEVELEPAEQTVLLVEQDLRRVLELGSVERVGVDPNLAADVSAGLALRNWALGQVLKMGGEHGRALALEPGIAATLAQLLACEQRVGLDQLDPQRAAQVAGRQRLEQRDRGALGRQLSERATGVARGLAGPN
ncbi:hypothetical protein ENSA7_42280 [Enhygromyxa salina]|uniref:Uncharacterized protein n=1 Tax=Enhygromyxa salina TaxID=215803 RepID=A0A2S9YLX9_9BACT|nr:hypothetical protein ENSA7_42280 [Enhygromyxa salina]